MSEYSAAVLADLKAMVAAGLHLWQLPPSTAVTLLNVSENATFGLHAAGRDLVVRIHRLGYSSAAEIESELAWICALRAACAIDTAAPVAAVDDRFVQRLRSPAGHAARHAVVFERLPGRHPETDSARWFERLGELTARMHGHARVWALPDGFSRKRWDVDSMVGPHAHWGPWRAAHGLDPAGAAVIERAIDAARDRLERFGLHPSRFGLIHADLRLANLLADGEHLRIIDFDDCGFSWFLYDFATAVSFIEHEAIVPALLDAWLSGYRRVAPLERDDVAEIPTLVLLRRIVLTAWLASHAEVPFAQQFGAEYSAGTVELARRFLNGQYLTGGQHAE